MASRFRIRLAATAAAASLAVAGGVVVVPAATAAPPSSPELDYFSYAFPGLRENSVFETVTFERFEYLLGSEGTFAFLIGGPEDATTNATIGHIDAVAQQYGVDTVYTFDPRLDGDDVDIRTTSLTDVAALWTRVVGNHLNKDTSPAFGGDPADDPYLFIYDASNTVGDAEDRIVAQLAGPVDTASLATEEGANAYRAQVAGVFDAVAVEGQAVLDTQSQFSFYRNEINRRHAGQYSNAATHGGEIISAADGESWKLKQITYPELLQVLESDGSHVVFFGGTWCHNTRAFYKDVNRAAAAAGVDTVYQFDLRLDGTSAGNLHIRDTASQLSYLYGDIVAEYFPNLRTQYRVEAGGSQKVDYHPGGDTSAAVASAQKLQVPYLIQYDSSNAAAPIAQDWIRDNGNGTYTEYMTEWWWVAGLPGSRPNNVSEANWPARQAQNWAFADEAVAKIDGFFGLAMVPEAPAAPTAEVAEQDVKVTWTAPADGGSALTGFHVSLDGGAPVVLAADATSHTFTDVAAGPHSVTVAAVNYLGTSPASSAASFSVTAPTASPTPTPTPSPTASAEPTVTVTGDLRPGGSIVVTGSGLPADTAGVQVEIRSTPQSLGTVTTSADGSFRLQATIPSSVTAGAHTVVVLVDGQVVASAAVTVAGGLAATGGAAIPFVIVGSALALVIAGVVLQIVRSRRVVD